MKENYLNLLEIVLRSNDSMISDGTIVLGTVHEPIVSSGYPLKRMPKVQGCIIMQNAIIEEGATVINSIIAEGTVVKNLE